MAKVWTSIKSFTLKSKRVWLALKKPSKQEFETIAKVSAAGIVVLGLFGFIISIFMKMIF